MPHVRRAPARARGRRHRSSGAAAALIAALTLGLLATPYGAVAAPIASPEPTGSQSPSPQPSPSSTPEPSAVPAPSPAPETSPTPEPSPPAVDVEPPAPSPAREQATTPEPAPSPAETPNLTVPVDPAPARPSLRQQARDVSIMAAGAAEAPVEVWNEGFTVAGTSATTAITQVHTYGGTNYSGDVFWYGTPLIIAPYINCNGLIITYNVTWPVVNANCSTAPVDNARLNVRRLADVLGQVGAGVAGATTAAGATDATSTAVTRNNFALVEWTSSGSGAAGGTSVIARGTNIAPSGLASGSRYYAASIDLAEASCADQFGRAQLTLSLGSAATASQSSIITACTDSRARFFTSPLPAGQTGWINGGATVRAGRFVADNASLLTAAQVAAQRPTVRNLNLGSGGNDFAIDNLRVVDVSPTVDIAFAGAAVAGVPTRLTYTVTNTTELGAKNDWAFVNTLPAGLTLSGGLVSSTCGDGALVADSNARVVSLSGGDLAAGTTSCTIEVDVIADAAGTYTNNAAAFGTLTGLIGPAPAALTVTAGSQIVLAKALPSGRSTEGQQFTLSVRQGATELATATTTGTGTQVDYTPSQVRRTVTPGVTYTIHERQSSGAGLSYATSYSCVRSGTVIASGQSPSGTITVPSGTPADIVCTFTNTPQSVRFQCDVNHFYSVTSVGLIRQGDIVTGDSIDVATIPSSGTEQVNGLGIRQPATGPATDAYALVRPSGSATTLSRIVKITAGGVATNVYTPSTPLNIGVGAIGGAIDAEGRYVFGGYANSGAQFNIWSYTEGAAAPVQLGYIATTSATPAFGNGDVAFDSRGNLYVLGAASTGDAQAAIFTVTRTTLDAARAAPATTQLIARRDTIRKPLSGTNTGAALTSVNGIAFSPRGTAYLSDAANVYEFDPTTWTRVGGTAQVSAAYTDLASCSSPSTITVQKNVVGRAAATDQFALTLEASSGTVDVATTNTTGAATGLQAQQIGPVPAPIDAVLTITEEMAAGSTNAIATYRPIYECWSNGVRIATGSAATGTVTMPSTLSKSVNCTFFNTPQPVSNLTITKQVLDPATGATAAASGWTVGVALAPTVGYATALPSEAATQQTNAQGQAVWTLLYGATTARATLTVSETQQTGFAFVSGACTVNGAPQAVTFSQVGAEVRASIPNTQSSSTVACTFVNRPIATLTLQKVVSLGSLAPSSWTLNGAGPATALAGPNGTTGVTATVSPGVAYRLTETGGSALYAQVGAWGCTTSAGAAVPVTAQGDVTIARGTTVTCRVTNATARLTLLKEVQGAQTGFQPENWRLTATPAPLAGASLPTESRLGAAYAAAGNAASTFDVRPGHSYTLSEAVAASGTRLAYRELRLERLDGTTWTTVTSPTIVAPGAGQSAVYRFVNDPVPPLTLPLTGGESADSYLLIGGAFLALFLAAASVHGWRRSRRRLT